MYHPCRFLLVASALLLGSGCEHTIYELLLQPRGSVMKRTLECRRVDSDGPQGEVLRPMVQEELDRLTAVYDVPAGPTEARRFAFAGEFGGSTPADIGGAGAYRCWSSSLGTLCVYAERFRGNDDQAGVLARRQQAADRLVDLIGAWLQPRLGQTREWSQFQAFLNGALRSDLHNLTLLAWAGRFAQDAGFAGSAGSADAASLARALLFLYEHGYLLAPELPAWARAIREQEAVPDSLAPLASLLAGAVARRSGIAADAEVLLALRRELEQKTLVDGLNAALQAAPEWTTKLADWQAREPKEAGAQAPAPVEILGDLALATAGFGPASGSPGDELRLRLTLPAKPFYTNGTWDAAALQVAWQTVLPGTENTPYLAYASWAAPAEAAQKQHFGRVLLRDQALAEYVLWFNGLSKEEAVEWEALLGSLRPEAAPALRLAEFRFQSEVNAGPATAAALAASRAQPARTLLLEALAP
jgi:hypothetical protein